jgi:Mg2+ and Co2+ transporter CorA
VTPLAETPENDHDRTIRCIVYDGGATPETLDDFEAISEVIAQRKGFVWLDIAQPSAADLALLQREFDIHPVATEHEIFLFKRALVVFRSTVAPMREILLRLTHPEIAPLKPGLGLYFRDVHDHVLRALEQIDITRDLVNSTLDIHLASQSHRQNEVSKH